MAKRMSVKCFLFCMLLVLGYLVLFSSNVNAISIGAGVNPNVNTEDFEPKVWMCDSRVVYDDYTEPGRISNGDEELIERINNYAFEGEQISWRVLVLDKNGIDKIRDVYATIGQTQGAGNDIEVNCQFDSFFAVNATLASCSDSDRGNNHFVSGTVVNNEGNNSDFCVNNNILTEYNCNANGSLSAVNVSCSNYGNICLNGACVASKRVFLTSMNYTGDLGGVQGADAKCQRLADSGGLGGNWKAWLSTNSTTTPATRFERSTNPYLRVGDNAVIANNWSDLTDGTLDNPINKDERGNIVNNAIVWSAASISGGWLGGGDCLDWTTNSSAHLGFTGLISTTSLWTQWALYNCDRTHKLYCFEQPLANASQPLCGNGIIESGEECDGNEFGENTCQAFGFNGGALGCSSCQIDISSCTATPDESCNARILEEQLENISGNIAAYYNCTFTVETADSMYGEYWITVEAQDNTGLMGTMDENEFWFLNPVIALKTEGDLTFDEVRPGTQSYSSTMLIGNEADAGSGVMMDMFISGTDFYDSAHSGAKCPTTNQLILGDGDSRCEVNDPFCYFATNGAYSTQNDGRNDAEGYVGIDYGIGFNNPDPFYNNNEIIQAQQQGPYWAANILAPGAEMAITFRLNLPELCNGNFDTGSIYFWGEAI